MGKAKKRAKMKMKEQQHLSKLDLTPEEEADIPNLLENNTHQPQKDPMQNLAQALGVTIIQKKCCVACNLKTNKMQPHFTINQWKKMYDGRDGSLGPRCKKCVEKNKFPPNDASLKHVWGRLPSKRLNQIGMPKDPAKILCERGFLSLVKGESDGRVVPDLTNHPPEKIGRLVLGLEKADELLDFFELVGFWGYGGVDEGLCCMPGCRRGESEGDSSSGLLLTCERCGKVKYCCKDHQRWHYRFHKEECLLAAGRNTAPSLAQCTNQGDE